MLSNCSTFVIEGNDITCSCNPSGSPPAVVTWYTTGAANNILLLNNVSRSLDGQNYTCNQYWGGATSNWRTTTFTVHVKCESPFYSPLHFREAEHIVWLTTEVVDNTVSCTCVVIQSSCDLYFTTFRRSLELKR